MIPSTERDLKSVVFAFVEENRTLLLRKLAVKPGGDQEEAIHQLRVATKKVRTVFRLASFIAPDHFHQKAEIKDLRSLFRTAGLLRELQVHDAVVSAYEELHACLYRPLSKLLLREKRGILPYYEEARAEFKPSQIRIPIKRMTAVIDALSSQELAVAMQLLCRQRIDAIGQVMPQGYEPENIHKGRILLKEAMYLLGILNTAKLLDPTQVVLLEKAKIAAEIAGDWHDREAFYHWLRYQMRPNGTLSTADPALRLLVQDLSVHTVELADDFRKALVPVLRSVTTETHPAQ
jgi:CHAD domain-containing protein